MFPNINPNCVVVDISKRNTVDYDDFDFDSLIPDTAELSGEELSLVSEVNSKLKERQGKDPMPIDIYNELLRYFLEKRDFRTVLMIVLQANTGLRYSDISRFRRIDIIDENNRFRSSIVDIEKKTGKQRVNFLNSAVKMAALMHSWNSPKQKPFNPLITATGNNKGWLKEKYKDVDGKEKCLRVNGKYVYVLDENGDKIPTPLDLKSANRIIKDGIISGLGVPLKNDCRTSSDKTACLNIATHSLRKAYAAAVVEQYVNFFDHDIAYAHAAAMEQLQYDLNHSSRKATYHYVGDYVEMKAKINMKMNLGIEILAPYFENERKKHNK